MKKIAFLIVGIIICISITSCEGEEKMNSSTKSELSSINSELSINSAESFTVVEDSSQELEPININSAQKTKIFECCYKSMFYSTYTGLTIGDIYKIVNFSEIKFAYDNGETLYYYARFRFNESNVFVFFHKYKGDDKNTLWLSETILANKRYDKNSFDKILINKSNLSDVLDVDPTTSFDNSEIFNIKKYDKFSLHLTEKGILYIGYNKKNIVKCKKELKGDWIEHFKYILDVDM